MILLNKIENFKTMNKTDKETVCKLYAPFFPHFAEEVWQTFLNNDDSIFNQSWPKAEKITSSKVAYRLQVNGKTRKVIDVNLDESEESVKSKAMELVASFLQGKEVEKTIFVPGRVVNFVVK
jgi:leucyl-tRNA synthetase